MLSLSEPIVNVPGSSPHSVAASTSVAASPSGSASVAQPTDSSSSSLPLLHEISCSGFTTGQGKAAAEARASCLATAHSCAAPEVGDAGRKAARAANEVAACQSCPGAGASRETAEGCPSMLPL